MELHLEGAETQLLAQVVSRHISDLRAEIVKTENYAMRQDLKHDEDVLKGILARLQGAPAGA
jgi:hypothetical protein